MSLVAMLEGLLGELAVTSVEKVEGTLSFPIQHNASYCLKLCQEFVHLHLL